MEDSEDESDEYYDQFDLGDFTKEEIRRYESMVGPGERLRDAAPPAKPLAEVLESSCERDLGPWWRGIADRLGQTRPATLPPRMMRGLAPMS